jgi:DNA-binding NtrC family response regulator
MSTILCVDDDVQVSGMLGDTLERAGHSVVFASNVVEALQALARTQVELIITDYRMPGLSGLEFISLLRDEGYEIPMILITGHGSIEQAVAAIKTGAVDYITKPVMPQQLIHAVAHALEVERLRRENDALRSAMMEVRGERAIVGESPQMRQTLQEVAMAAPTRATVLLQGESGTGKELFARAIHDQSERRDRPFVKMNCAALPEGLIESALFGHEKGAFTGAMKRVEGAFERANGGTLLLDEVSEMRLDLQAKLLRVLQEREFERVGGSATIRVDVRIIATTNRDLAREAAEGRFRQDLYYRLSVLPIYLPPLRERPEDIPLLAHRFAMNTAKELKKEIVAIAPDAMAALQRHNWPGNVRELQHAVERAVILCVGNTLQLSNFEQRSSMLEISKRVAAASGNGGDAVPSAIPPDGIVLPTLDVGQAERLLIEEAMKRTNQNRTQAAKLLGIGLRTLRGKLNSD